MLYFDHVIITVQNLDEAIQNYKDLGFNVLFGGTHVGGATRNALICFHDGTYMELLGPSDDPDAPATDYTGLIELRKGLAGYALYTDNLDEEYQKWIDRGVLVEPPRSGGRVRGDGTELRWQTSMIGGSLCPFVICDQTPRAYRVPDDPESTTHPNGAEGIVELTIVTPQLDAAHRQYTDLLGRPPLEESGMLVFDVDGIQIMLIKPFVDSMRERARRWGDVPHLLTLRTVKSEFVGQLDPEKTTSANLWLIQTN